MFTSTSNGSAMFRLFRLRSVSVCLLPAFLCSIVFAADKKPTQTRAEVHFEHVVPASHLLNTPVVQAEKQGNANERLLGIVRDFLIDLSSADVPLAVIENTAETHAKLHVLPLSQGKLRMGKKGEAAWEIDSKTQAAMEKTSLNAKELPANADQALSWFQAFQLKAPWGGEVNVQQPVEFVSLRSLFWQQIQNEKHEHLGTITEYVLVPQHGRLAYTLMTPGANVTKEKKDQPDKSRRLVIPLSAYVRSDNPHTWILNIPATEMAEEKLIGFDAFPKELPRAWIEYVSVRYGADVEKGLQAEPKKSRD